MSRLWDVVTWMAAVWLGVCAIEAMLGIKKAGAALERIAARLEGPITISVRHGGGGPEGEELDLPPLDPTAPPAITPKVKVLN